MNRVEHLLAKVAEECGEVAERALKAQQFGLTEVQPGDHANPMRLNNAARINAEYNDLIGVLEMLAEATGLEHIAWVDHGAIAAKKAKVEHFLRHAKACGTLTE